MFPVWLIEADVYGDEIAPLVDEIHRQGMSAGVVPHQAIRRGICPTIAGQTLAPDACVIGYGTYPFAQEILIHHRWTPGAWCSASNLDCAVYYPHFTRYLLNQPHAILPGVDAVQKRDELFAEFGRDDEVFARPTSSHKLFVGRCVQRDEFATALAPTRYDPASCVVIACPQPINREWRLVVVEGRVVAGSQYMVNGERTITPDCPAEVRAFADSMLAEILWRPDPVFMLDVCESGDRLWLVELNSFSGSWLYRCDLRAVVEAVSELAQRLWRERTD